MHSCCLLVVHPGVIVGFRVMLNGMTNVGTIISKWFVWGAPLAPHELFMLKYLLKNWLLRIYVMHGMFVVKYHIYLQKSTS